MLSQHPAAGAVVGRITSGPARLRASRIANYRIVGVPVIRISEIAYVLPGSAPVCGRLKYGAVPRKFAIPPHPHRNLCIQKISQIKTRAVYCSLLAVAVRVAQSCDPGVIARVSAIYSRFGRSSERPVVKKGNSRIYHPSPRTVFIILRVRKCIYTREKDTA